MINDIMKQIKIIKDMIRDTPTEWYVKKEKIDNIFEALDILADTINIALEDSDDSTLHGIAIKIYRFGVSGNVSYEKLKDYEQQIKDLINKKLDEI